MAQLTISQSQFEVYYNDFSELDVASEGSLGRASVERLLQQQLMRTPTELEISLFMAEFDADQSGVGTQPSVVILLKSMQGL